MNFPQTSRRLLAALGSDLGSSRWNEFIAAYAPGLRDYAARHFPGLDADDLIQETLLAFVKRLPNYIYDPESRGAFHAYLVGILRICGLTALNRANAETKRIAEAGEQLQQPPTDAEQQSWQEAAYEIALRQFFADPRVHAQTKEIFRRVAMQGEKPETVAQDYGLERNAVDQIKDRSIRRLRIIVDRLVSQPEAD